MVVLTAVISGTFGISRACGSSSKSMRAGRETWRETDAIIRVLVRVVVVVVHGVVGGRDREEGRG